MILPIILYGNPILSEASKPVPKDYGLEELVRNMYETLHATKGVGLAAVQVGIPYRLFITNYTSEKEEEFIEVFVNPKIIRKWSLSTFEVEGCLSFPGIAVQVERRYKVELSYEDMLGHSFTKIFSGTKARIIQHEMDHVDGRYFIDNLEYADRMPLNSYLEKIKNKDVNIHYDFI